MNFLDLLIIRSPPSPSLEIDIYRKYTTTNTAVNYLSNHPIEHKISAYRYHINRMQKLLLTTERQQTEWNTIKTVSLNNNFPENFITNVTVQIKQQRNSPSTGLRRKQKPGNLYILQSKN
jgi:hypothetical protein